MNIEKLTVEQTLQQAVAFQQAGKLQEAGGLYRAILQTHPNHPEANHNMGVLAVQMKQPAAGLPYFVAALDADPARGQFWLSYIDALFQSGQMEDARQIFALAQEHGLQGDEVEALAARLKGGAQVAEQPNAEDQHAPKESPPVSSADPKNSKKKSKAKSDKPGKSAHKSATHQGESPSPQEMNTLVALFTKGRLEEAATLAQSMTVRFPRHAFGWKALGAVFKQMGRGADALSPMQKAADLSPGDIEAHFDLGVTLQELGRLNEAETCFRQTLQINPDDVDAHNNLAIILQNLSRPNEAEASLRRVLEIAPNYAEGYSNLGVILHSLGRLDEAEASYRHALQLNPDYAEGYNNLGITLHDLGRPDEAEASYRRALQIKPDYAKAHSNLGITLQELDRLEEAEACHQRALQIKPDYAEAHNNLGITLRHLSRPDEAEASYRHALQIKPDYAEAHINLGSTLKDMGRLDEAEARFRRALEIKPDSTLAHSNLIFTQDLMIGEGPASLHEERKRWHSAHAAHLHQQRTHINIQDPVRRIRIGYISADFRDHSAAKAFGGMLTQYDRSQFEVFAYSNFKGKDDRFTALFKQNVTAWRNIVGLSDDAAAEMIREDQIDILVDLSGHSAGNRLLVFARKPAPIQITAWGYAAGTGMQAMDVFFADPVLVRPEDKPYFTENVRYLPCAVGSFFIDPFPGVNELPALSGGIVTFGSLNRLAKVSDKAYRAWAGVLLAVPRSRLILKAIELNDASIRKRVIGHFTKVGVAADRIIMQGKTSWYEQMQAYHQIDIALDPFPQGGGVTALEGLMMGVPMINLRGPTVAGRLSASIMTTLGLTDWIAETPEQYVELAKQKAADLQSLAALRKQLRGIFTSSVIGNPVAYARAVEKVYRQLWREWCNPLKSS